MRDFGVLFKFWCGLCCGLVVVFCLAIIDMWGVEDKLRLM